MEPLVFEPYLRPMIWGGRRLGELLHKPLPPTGTFGESWEISCHPLHLSRVAQGPLRGTTLADLCASQGRELFGQQLPREDLFPLLIKFLDCREWLSIQVHPTDELAPRLSQEKSGKTEAWVVLEAAASGRIFAGLKAGVGPAEVETQLRAGKLDQCLHSFAPRPGDCLFLPAGIVHGVGGGVVLAEVQQSSDATFRLFDWNRLGNDGKPRPLHVSAALQTINWQAGPVNPVCPQPLAALPAGIDGHRLVSCRYFIMDRFQLRQSWPLPEQERLAIWLVLEGSAWLDSEATGLQCRRGDTVLIPASAAAQSWHLDAGENSATMLRIVLPAQE